ncbi:MAG: nuclear transport factor 2 family protein [Acidobacteria bacterium]|nr:nuclear transport factor 2 family protein [Acidobacteriota bacterium]
MTKMVLAALLLGGQAFAQSLESVPSQAALEKLSAALDAQLFGAYNRCELEQFTTYFAEGVEFYHDQTGVTVGKAALSESLQKNICGGDVLRELVPGTLETHRMKGYGFVQMGTHRFLHPKSKTAAGEARFVHLWQYKDGAWKVTRVLSFDHHEAKP